MKEINCFDKKKKTEGNGEKNKRKWSQVDHREKEDNEVEVRFKYVKHLGLFKAWQPPHYASNLRQLMN